MNSVLEKVVQELKTSAFKGVRIELKNDVIILTGVVNSFHLKQIAQEIVLKFTSKLLNEISVRPENQVHKLENRGIMVAATRYQGDTCENPLSTTTQRQDHT